MEGTACDTRWGQKRAALLKAAEAMIEEFLDWEDLANKPNLRQIGEGERRQTNALPEKWQPPSRAVEPDRRIGVAMDGMMIHMRQDRWEELKVGATFDIEVRLGQDERTREPVPMAHAVHNSYVAHLGGSEVFGEMLFREACRRGWEQAQDTQVVADGAAWI